MQNCSNVERAQSLQPASHNWIFGPSTMALNKDEFNNKLFLNTDMKTNADFLELSVFL